MRSYQWKLAVIICVVLAMGHIIPPDFKVVFGLCCGLAGGTYLFPAMMKDKMERNMKKAWSTDRDQR